MCNRLHKKTKILSDFCLFLYIFYKKIVSLVSMILKVMLNSCVINYTNDNFFYVNIHLQGPKRPIDLCKNNQKRR